MNYFQTFAKANIKFVMPNSDEKEKMNYPLKGKTALLIVDKEIKFTQITSSGLTNSKTQQLTWY